MPLATVGEDRNAKLNGHVHRVWFVVGVVDVEYPLCAGSCWNIGQSCGSIAVFAFTTKDALKTIMNASARTKRTEILARTLRLSCVILAISKLSPDENAQPEQ